MPKPKSKLELLEASKENFKKLTDFIAQKSQLEQDQTFPLGMMNRNIRDVLAHVHHWHLLFLEWYKIGMSGQKTSYASGGLYVENYTRFE